MIRTWWVHVIIHLSEFMDHITQRVNRNVDSALWVVMTRPCRFSGYDKWTIVLGDDDHSGGHGEEGVHV